LVAAASTKPKTSADTSKVQNTTIQQFVSEWNEELQKQLKAFADQSQKVAKWDEELMLNADRVRN